LDTQNTVKLVASSVTWSHTTWFVFLFRRWYCQTEGCQWELENELVSLSYPTSGKTTSVSRRLPSCGM